jgi:hypothetical protein
MLRASSRKVWAALTAGAVLFIVALLAAWSAGNNAHAATANATVKSRTTAGAPASPRPCGTWSEQGSAAANAAVSSRTIRNCLGIGTDWVLTTVGGPTGSANVGVLQCGSNAACAEGATNPAGYAHWHWFQPAGVSGGATILTVNGTTLILDIGGSQMSFNISNEHFSTETEN